MSALRKALEAHLPNDITATFKRMELAENEIAKMKRRYPSKVNEIHNAFKLLCPSKYMVGITDAVYKHHCRELIRRVINGEDTRPATYAEMLCVCSKFCASCKPTRAFCQTFEYLFCKVMPNKYATLEYTDFPRREDMEEVNEFIDDMRKWFTVEDRSIIDDSESGKKRTGKA